MGENEELKEQVSELEKHIKVLKNAIAPVDEVKFLREFNLFYGERYSNLDISLIPKEIKVKLFKLYKEAVKNYEVSNLKEWFKYNYYLITFNFYEEILVKDKLNYQPLFDTQYYPIKGEMVFALYIEKLNYYLKLNNVIMEKVNESKDKG